MKKTYTKKQIQEAIAYWKKQLAKGNYRKVNEALQPDAGLEDYDIKVTVNGSPVECVFSPDYLDLVCQGLDNGEDLAMAEFEATDILPGDPHEFFRPGFEARYFETLDDYYEDNPASTCTPAVDDAAKTVTYAF